MKAYLFTHEDMDEPETCGAVMLIYPHRFAEKPLPNAWKKSVPANEEMWDDFWPDCPARGERMDLIESGPPSSYLKHYPEPTS